MVSYFPVLSLYRATYRARFCWFVENNCKYWYFPLMSRGLAVVIIVRFSTPIIGVFFVCATAPPHPPLTGGVDPLLRSGTFARPLNGGVRSVFRYITWLHSSTALFWCQNNVKTSVFIFTKYKSMEVFRHEIMYT